MSSPPPTSNFLAQDAAEVARRIERDMALSMGESGFSLQEKLALGCRVLAHEGHARSLAGQITVRAQDGVSFWTTHFTIGLAETRASNVLRIDAEMNVLEGQGMANPAVRFHMWIYNALPHLNSIVHTHPPYASALAMGDEALAFAHMDAMMLYDDCAWLKDWPGVPLANEEGRIISEALGDKHSILLAHHGLLTTGRTLEEAVYRAVFFEQAAQLQLLAGAVGPIRPVDPELARSARDFLLKEKVVNATFNYWARRAARREPEVLG